MPDFEVLLPVVTQPYLEDHLGLWLFEEKLATQLGLDHIASRDWDSHLQSSIGRDPDNLRTDEIETADGGKIAVIEITGTMMKRTSSMSAATSTIRAKRAVRNARTDRSVNAAAIKIDSGGGTFIGTQELADEVAALAAEKPTEVYVEDRGFSAAYWVASQANRITMNQSGAVGSIGTVLLLNDMSKMAEKMGVKVHVISTGKFKGAGAPGSEVTDEQLKKFKEEVVSANEFFLEAAAKGRKMDRKRVEELATGEIFIGQKAIDVGLVDEIGTFDDVIRRLQKMSEPQAATPQQISETCPGASAEFKFGLIEKGATLEQVRQEWAEHQQKEMDRLTKENEELKKKAEGSGKKPKKTEKGDEDGLDPDFLSDDSEGELSLEIDDSTGNPAFDEADKMVQTIMRRDKCSRREAIKKVMVHGGADFQAKLLKAVNPASAAKVDEYKTIRETAEAQ